MTSFTKRHTRQISTCRVFCKQRLDSLAGLGTQKPKGAWWKQKGQASGHAGGVPVRVASLVVGHVFSPCFSGLYPLGAQDSR